MEIVQANEAYLKATLELSKAKLHFHTIQFLKKSNLSQQNYKPQGSGVLVKIDNQYLIFTASHVIEEEALYVNTRIGIRMIEGTYSQTDLNADKFTDICYIILDQMFGLLLTEGYEFLHMNKIIHSHKPTRSANYMVSGYPEKNIWIKEGKTYTGSSHFLLHMSNEKVFKYYGFDSQKNYVLNFAGKGLNILTEKKSDKIEDPYCMSGSGLWLLAPDIINYKIVIEYFLIGIMFMFKKTKYHVLVGNRIELIIDDILKKLESFKA